MEVGIEECLHIEFEYGKAKYSLKVRAHIALKRSQAKCSLQVRWTSAREWVAWLRKSPMSWHGSKPQGNAASAFCQAVLHCPVMTPSLWGASHGCLHSQCSAERL